MSIDSESVTVRGAERTHHDGFIAHDNWRTKLFTAHHTMFSLCCFLCFMTSQTTRKWTPRLGQDESFGRNARAAFDEDLFKAGPTRSVVLNYRCDSEFHRQRRMQFLPPPMTMNERVESPWSLPL